MLKNYFKIALRNIFGNKTYSVINIFGLSVGIAGAILILLYVQNEFSYDKFNMNYKNIYRVVTNRTSYGRSMTMPVTSANLGPALNQNFREVKNYARIYDLSPIKYIINYNDKAFYSDGLMFADSSFFDIFSFKLLKGSRSSVLTNPFSLAITKSMAEKLFGDQDPIGKVIRFARWNGKAFNYTVTGVTADPSQNSSLQFNFIASFNTLYSNAYDFNIIDNWNQRSFYTYILLSGNNTAKNLETNLPAFLAHQPGMESVLKTSKITLFLQPLEDVHLFSPFDILAKSYTDVRTLYILSAIAVFLLLIACINFINLSTARYTKRAKEMAVRKVMGAPRTKLIGQFMAESLVMSLLATIIAVVIVALTIPFTGNLMGVELKFYIINETLTPLAILSVGLITGVLAGIYPAIFLTSFKTDSVLKNNIKSPKIGGAIRTGMVAVQFTISIALIACTILVQRQIGYIQNSDLGFNKNNIALIPFPNVEAVNHADIYRTEVQENPDILATSAASSFPGLMNMSAKFRLNAKESRKIWMSEIYADPDYLKLLGLKIKSGRLPESAKNKDEVLINETAAKELGLKNAAGKELITGDTKKLRIAGVIKNYNFKSVHDKIGPLVIQITPTSFGFILCKINPGKKASAIKFLRNKWAEVNKDIPFEYTFLKNDLNNLYTKEIKFSGITDIFSGMAILIACLGLLGLSSFNIEQRTKEIGIRKVLGASIPGILKLVTKQFMVIVLLSNIVAWPVSYWFINKWLRTFAFKIEISVWAFILSGAIALLIALVTVGILAVKAATANPIKSLRYE